MEEYKIFSLLTEKDCVCKLQKSAHCKLKIIPGDVNEMTSYLLGGILQVEQWLTAPLEEESQLVLFRGCLLLALRTWCLVQHLVENSAIQPETFTCADCS